MILWQTWTSAKVQWKSCSLAQIHKSMQGIIQPAYNPYKKEEMLHVYHSNDERNKPKNRKIDQRPRMLAGCTLFTRTVRCRENILTIKWIVDWIYSSIAADMQHAMYRRRELRMLATWWAHTVSTYYYKITTLASNTEREIDKSLSRKHDQLHIQ